MARRSLSAPVALAALVTLAVAVLALGAPRAHAQRGGANATPVYAYYYIWFNPSSWNRAKRDYPLLGRYSSDEVSIMREHIRLAKSAGIDGFLVSWKGTPTLNARLEKLIRVARRNDFRLGIVYQGLDFERRPQPTSLVQLDLDLFARRYARSPVFRGFGKPVVVWSGTWEFSRAQIARVTSRFRDRLTILGSEKRPDEYLAKASLFDGNAYYWSSVNPDTYPGYPQKLRALGNAVHSRGGLWFAPAAPGFDARMIGGHTVVGRDGGETLRRQFDAAQGSDPDAIGLISFNEFSENSHVEPSLHHGAQALEVLADIRGARFSAKDDLDSSEALTVGRSGPTAVPVLTGFGLLLLASALLLRRGSRRRPRAAGGRHGVKDRKWRVLSAPRKRGKGFS